jgi:uncharacterized protein YjiS (DUF1127 family)
MQPQSKLMHRSAVASVVASEARTADMDSTISRIRGIKVWPTIREWLRRWRERRELRAMSQREIADFCPKLTDALREAEKPFWRP